MFYIYINILRKVGKIFAISENCFLKPAHDKFRQSYDVDIFWVNNVKFFFSVNGVTTVLRRGFCLILK